MRCPRNLSAFALAAVAVLAVPLRSDGGPECDNVTTSLQSTLNNPVAGDEKFFTLPVGPSNVMFLLDCSGSMQAIPQCGDANAWGDSNALATCKWPTTWNTITNPASGTLSEDGTCSVASNPNLAWMTTYTPTANLADPGKGIATNGLADTPSWGTGCTGGNCLFQFDKVYRDQSWGETSAVPEPASLCTVEFTYQDYDCRIPSSPVLVDKVFRATLPHCSACLTNAAGKGFYFSRSWRAAYTVNNTTNSGGGGRRCTGGTSVVYRDGGGTQRTYFTGGWLNANPPKFISARKVIKDVAWIDPATTATTDQLRLGLSTFSTSQTSSARIVVPLGPSAADSYPVNPAAFVTARQLIIDALNRTHGGLPGWPAGATMPSLIDGGTPMATALFRIGQYFTSPGVYTRAFGSTYELPAFAQNTRGTMQASWVTSSSTSFCWSCQKSAVIIVTDGSPNTEMTWPPGFSPSYDQNVYTSAGNCGPGTSCTTSPVSGCCSPTDSTRPSMVPRVASWLHTPDTDLVPSALNNIQSIAVSAVSFGLPANNAQRILRATASMGGGMYNNAADGEALAAAVAQAVNQVSNTSTSFGAPAATALTTINAVDTKAFITRFRPNQKATWEGHLFQWMLFDELAAGCDPTKLADPSDTTQEVRCMGRMVRSNFDGDSTPAGHNVCTKSFLVDAECEEVYEEPSTGNWFKKGVTNDDGTPKAAVYFWDAGMALSDPNYRPNSDYPAGGAAYRTAAEPAVAGNIAPVGRYNATASVVPRNLWTALPDGTMLEFETRNAAALAPYMNLDQAWCASMESLARLCGAAPLPSCPVTIAGNWKTYCAQQVILFARGWDVMDQDGDSCAGPGFGTSPPTGFAPNPGNGAVNRLQGGTTANCALSAVGTVLYTGEERDRRNDAADSAPTFFKLGDIFHSSPVLVHPPTSEVMCRLGVDNQCVRTIFGYTSNRKYRDGYQTPLEHYDGCKDGVSGVSAYRRWRADLADRQNVVLVGANDGFLHAFDAGGPDTSEVDGNKQDLDCVWQNVLHGTGAEIWGFMPADLLPRVKDTMLNHQYMVDGNVMVRDVWVDDAPADSSSGNPVPADGNLLDGVKQRNEFRTVAIFGERSGGMMFNALDVTNAFDMTPGARPRPTVRWRFPPPRSEDAQYMAQSWSDTAPRPAPIGPVRLVATAADPATGSVPDPTLLDPNHRLEFAEKWVVMLNGGYDPTLNRGRAVWMLDAWTGTPVWRFTDTDFKREVLGNAANTATSMFPVAAGVAMVDIGSPTTTSLDADNFFDTATWGDLGGNLWVARFDQPGVRGTNGRVTNWKAARAFEQGRTANDAQYATNRSEFFYMTSNAWEPQRHQLRTMLGSGNREQILEQGQGCGPDNLMSCCQSGCSVSTTTTVNYGVCRSDGGFSCTSAGQMATAPFVQGCGSAGASACTGGATNTFGSSSAYAMTCGAAGTSTASGNATCDATGLCTVNPVGTGHDLVPPNAAACANKAKFYGVWSYGGLTGGGDPIAAKTFSTAEAEADNWATAITFDKNRFTDVPDFRQAGVCTYTRDGTCSLVETTHARVSSQGILSCLDSTARCSASASDPGWFFTYNVRDATSSDLHTIPTCTYEKTASGSAVVNSCTTWNTLQPRGSATTSSDPCSGAQTAMQLAVGYSSDYVTGVPTVACNQAIDTGDTDLAYRGTQRTTIAPPAAPMARNSVTRGGKVYYSTLQLDPGSAAASTGSGSRDVAAPLYWLEVSRKEHLCRHASAADCK